MFLKSLEIQGFKSFPDKTLIRFGNDITAIVGPNGSGKSNISDAISWVMGEQSSKALRGGKMEDVIFGGTQKRAPVGFAEATLLLDNADRALPYDADEVMVTRRYYRSGDSEYYINRQSARLRDINEMFMDTGLGKEGYSNISQGRIDEILSLKSTDRREIFEEAAGISKYRHRKEETERKLATTEDNLMRIGDKISELEMQLEPLKAQSEKAKKYLEHKKELQGLEVSVWLEQLQRLSAAAKKAEEDYNSAAFVLQQEHEALTELYRQTEVFADSLRSQDVQLEAARGALAAMESMHQQQEGQLAVLRGNVENNSQNIQRIQSELAQQDDRSGGIAQQIAQSQRRIEEVEKQTLALQRQLAGQQEALTRLTANAEGMTKRFLELRSRQSNLVADLAGCRADIGALENSLAQSKTRLAELEQEGVSGEARQQEAQTRLDTSRKKMQAAQEQAAAQKNAIAGHAMRLESRTRRRNEMQEQLRRLSGEMEGVGAKIRVYAAMERDFENYSKSVKAVMQESQRGRLTGIHGPVSRLIRTEDQFTAAIEIALGAAMQQIVVDTEQSAKAAIQFLKRTGAGRATFLPISAIQPRYLQERGLEQSSGFVGIAAQLVQCNEQYRRIVDNLLGRTVIAQNLDCAVAMGKAFSNRFRIVTLDGQVVNPGGSMTGGSMSKDAGILSRANELEKLNHQMQAMQLQKETQEKDLRELQRTVAQAEFEQTAAMEQLRKAEDEVLRLQGEEKQYSVLLQAILDAMSASGREKAMLKDRMGADREQIAARKAKQEEKTNQLTQTEAELATLEQGQTELTKQSEAYLDGITKLKTELAALEAEKKTASDNVLNLQQLQSAMEGDRTKKLALLAGLEDENCRLAEEIQKLLALQTKSDETTEKKRQSLQALQAARMTTEAAKTKAERDAQEKNKDILTMERTCALLEQKKVTSAMEEGQIVDKLWDSYGLTPGTADGEKVEIESVAAANRKIAELKRKISALGTPNLGAIEEYARVSERYEYLAGQRDDVLTSKRELESVIREITREMTLIFTTEFQKIDLYFGQTFVEMFRGGKASLVLEDPENPLTCGIEIRVQPPGKQLKTITLLSGGEKAFVAIALYFAILKVRPTPFCMLDEIDAALDDRNVERFASYLRNLCQKTQFIVITHRRGTMEASDILYGVTMQEQGVSKILHLDLNQMEQNLGIME